MAKVFEVARSASMDREIKECAVAFGVLVDKKNLMEGLPSSRHELHSTRATATINLQEEFAKLDAELAKEIQQPSEVPEYGSDADDSTTRFEDA